MVRHRNIEPGKVTPLPGSLPLPLPATQISTPEHTEKRHKEILVQRVPNETNPLSPHQTQKPQRIDPRQIAPFGDPFQGIDLTHVVSTVPEAVPGVPVERAGVVVGGFSIWIGFPVAVEEVARS